MNASKLKPCPCPAGAAGDAPALAFRVNAVPPTRTAQQKGAYVCNGHIRFFTKPGVAAEKENTVALVLGKLPQGWQPLEGPLEFRLHLVWPYRKGEPKKNTRDGAELPISTRPDLDNIAKGIIDALTVAGVWRDDSQIARMVLEKAWGPAPYWEVRVSRLGPTPAAPSPSDSQGVLDFGTEGGR